MTDIDNGTGTGLVSLLLAGTAIVQPKDKPEVASTP